MKSISTNYFINYYKVYCYEYFNAVYIGIENNNTVITKDINIKICLN